MENILFSLIIHHCGIPIGLELWLLPCLGLHPWHHPSQILIVLYLLLALLLTFTFYYNPG